MTDQSLLGKSAGASTHVAGLQWFMGSILGTAEWPCPPNVLVWPDGGKDLSGRIKVTISITMEDMSRDNAQLLKLLIAPINLKLFDAQTKAQLLTSVKKPSWWWWVHCSRKSHIPGECRTTAVPRSPCAIAITVSGGQRRIRCLTAFAEKCKWESCLQTLRTHWLPKMKEKCLTAVVLTVLSAITDFLGKQLLPQSNR